MILDQNILMAAMCCAVVEDTIKLLWLPKKNVDVDFYGVVKSRAQLAEMRKNKPFANKAGNDTINDTKIDVI